MTHSFFRRCFLIVLLASAAGTSLSAQTRTAASASASAKNSVPSGVPVSIRNGSFTEGMAGWSTFGRDKGALTTAAKGGVLSVVYKGTNDWAVSSRTRIPVQKDQVYQFTCSAQNNGTTETACFYVVTIQNNAVKSYHAAQTNFFKGKDWNTYSVTFTVPADVDAVYCRFNGKGATSLALKNVHVEQIQNELLPKSNDINNSLFVNNKFQGGFSKRPVESLDRGVAIVPLVPFGCFVSWRLLASDPENVAFSVTRIRNGVKTNLTETPVINATCFSDKKGKIGDTYIVTPIVPTDTPSQGMVSGSAEADSSVCKIIPIPGAFGAEKVAVGDLDGDGRYDYVVKTPAGDIDPSHHVASKKPYSLIAFRSDGKMLWQKNLGWNIESGTWYSPYEVADIDGDGKAEVIAKTGDDTSAGGKDWRDAKGFVTSGPEYLSVFDGTTGKQIARTNFISRNGFENYNCANRNQLAIAYLDGKTPCIIMIRGTYGLMKATALMYDKAKGQLVEVWTFSNEFLEARTRGQGGRYTICADVDDDGRDEVILGSLVLDDDGSVLWNTGRGHPDGIYFGDIDPKHAGNEVVFMVEKKQTSGGICMVDSATGKQLWVLSEPTANIYGRGLCADVDENFPGREVYGAESGANRAPNGRRWLFTASGLSLKTGAQLNREGNSWGFGPVTAYWNGTGLKSIIDKNVLPGRGNIILVADLYGDWREEVVIATKTDLRIYSTNIETTTRHTALMQDNVYRNEVMTSGSGFMQCPDTLKPLLIK